MGALRPRVKLHERFDRAVLAAAAGQKVENTFVKDAEYLIWRYEQNPLEKPVYKVGLYRGDTLVGYAVLATTVKRGILLACLMDMFCLPGEDMRPLVGQVKRAAASLGAYALLTLEHPQLVCFRDTWMTYTVKNRFNFIVKGQDAQWAEDLAGRRFGFTFGDLPQGYSTFSKYLVPEDERRDTPDLSDGAQGLRWRNRVLTVILVEGTTGIVLGLRTLALPIYFLRVLHRLIREQAWNGNERYDEQISEVVIRIAALDALPRSLVLSTCVVGRKQERPVTKESLSELEWVLTSGSAADGTAVYTVRTDLLQVWMYQEKDNWYTVLVRFDGTVRQRGMQPEAGEDLFQCATEVARTLLAAMLLPYIAIAFPEMLNAQTPD